MPPKPLALSDDELNAIVTACQPLELSQRDGFLQLAASLLRDCREIGPGTVQSPWRKRATGVRPIPFE